MRSEWIRNLAAATALCATGMRAGESPPPASLFHTVCATCHGAAGQGRKELFAPSIAGLPAWYVELQLEKFRLGYRGLPPDHAGAAMRSIAAALPEQTIRTLASHIETLDPHPAEGTLPEDLPMVAEYYLETCAPCHRYNGHGERAFQSAPITLLPAWYVESSLRKFRDGQRGAHPLDEHGQKMRGMTAHLSDAMIAELARYLSVLAETYPPARKKS